MSPAVHRVNGVVQRYAWGDERAIPGLLGVEPDGQPWAELWFGTHPNGPSTVADGRLLSDVAGPLPFLLKILAAGRPLSLQAHPSAARAREAHALGTYPDPYPKPEMLCALTPFDALCGIREPVATEFILREIGAVALADLLASAGVRTTIEALYRGRFDITATIDACRGSERSEARLAAQLADEFPGESSPVVTLLLNRVRLKPTEAIFLGPGNLHAYLSGVGVEVMAASDNVVRGGLTIKHVDVDELLRIVDPTPLPDPLVVVTQDDPGVFRYEVPDLPFELTRIETGTNGDGARRAHTASTDELVIVTAGGDAAWPQGVAVHLAPGDSVELPTASTVHAAAGAPG